MNRFVSLILALAVALGISLLSLPSASAVPANPTVPVDKMDKAWKSLSKDRQNRVAALMAAFKAKGFSPESAAGWLGNAWQETTFDPSVTNHLGTCGYFQMTDQRKANLLKAGGVTKCADIPPAAYVSFIVDIELKPDYDGGYELNRMIGPKVKFRDVYAAPAKANLESQGITGFTIPKNGDTFNSVDEMLKSKNWGFIAYMVCTQWERPGAGEANIGKRILYAATVLKYAGEVEPTAGGGDPSAAPSGGVPGQVSEEVAQQLNRPTSEWDLEGMPNQFKIEDGDALDIATRENLSISDRALLDEMKMGFESEAKFQMFRTASSVVSMIGVVLLFYSGLFIIGVVFDIAFAGGYSLGTRIVTLGTRQLWYGMGDSPKPKNALSLQGAVVAVLVLAVVGSMLLTGIATSLIGQLVRAF